jgi:hypothetical protein
MSPRVRQQFNVLVAQHLTGRADNWADFPFQKQVQYTLKNAQLGFSKIAASTSQELDRPPVWETA